MTSQKIVLANVYINIRGFYRTVEFRTFLIIQIMRFKATLFNLSMELASILICNRESLALPTTICRESQRHETVRITVCKSLIHGLATLRLDYGNKRSSTAPSVNSKQSAARIVMRKSGGATGSP